MKRRVVIEEARQLPAWKRPAPVEEPEFVYVPEIVRPTRDATHREIAAMMKRGRGEEL